MSTRSYKFGRKQQKYGKIYQSGKYIFFYFSDEVDDEYSYAGHDFAAGGTFSFGGVTVQANRHDDDDEEEGDNVMTSMNANDFQYGSYYNEESDEYTSDDNEEEEEE